MAKNKPYCKPVEVKQARPDCYCNDNPHQGFTCNACFNGVLESKNTLVRENYEILSKNKRYHDTNN